MNPASKLKCSAHCACSNDRQHTSARSWDRRDFLKAMGLGVSILATQPWHAMAGPFTRKDFERLVPADKKLAPDWVRFLTDRGERTVYQGTDLDKIGMPIGGICAGQLYLGGDGKLWLWDIFNQRISTGPDHYAKPLAVTSPIEQGFGVRLIGAAGTEFRPLDRNHWREISFIGEYPIAYIDYQDPEMPIRVKLEAFSPFIPLNTEDSSLPATILEFTVGNRSPGKLELELCGWLQNAVCLYTGQQRPGFLQNRVRRGEVLAVECSASEAPSAEVSETRPDILFEDFESPTYSNWSVEGTAFGRGPIEMSKIPAYQGDVGGQGARVVNSHASAPGATVEQRDAATGALTSKPFTVTRNYINFLIGGGAHKGKTCLNLLLEQQVVATATGQNDNHMSPMSWDVTRWAGKTAVLQIVDHESGAWGNIGVDNIVFSDKPRETLGSLATQPDFGSLTLALLRPWRTDSARAAIAKPGENAPDVQLATKPFGEKLIGSVTRRMRLAPGESAKATFVLSWHMANLNMSRLPPGRHYAIRFASAAAVTGYVAKSFQRLAGQTRLWHDTWYDSTLPYWFLDRTFLNTSILATSTAHRFADGRFYGWEGVGCCEGTCGHVWQYAHAMARLFPDLERLTREKVDFGLALQPDGAIHFRGEFNDFPAIDAQAGAVLRALREHQMAPDSAFLRRTWPNIKRATEWLICKDENGDGLIESNQHNTLDTDWFGPVAWLSGLYVAALRAAETMAMELGDAEFAARCRRIANEGQQNLVRQLFDGEYFINKPDARHLDAINSGTGCEIDQVFGQSWAFQVGLPRVFPERETVAALKSLWRYNFTPDVGPYRKQYQAGRWYAMPGEAGLLMCSFPRSDWDYAQAKGKGPDWAAGYFNECMNGFEYQAAGHMLWEGLITEGLAVTRAVHDRYHASRRNPWNEVECGDHYARSMASYGVFLAACGFEHHGPNGHLGFAPRVVAKTNGSKASSFKAAFITAQGWGTFSQDSSAQSLSCSIHLKWGKLRVRSLDLELPQNARPSNAQVHVNGRRVNSEHTQRGKRVQIILTAPAVIEKDQAIDVRLS